MKVFGKIIVVAAFVVGCGAPDADQQAERKLDKPDFQIVEHGFFLNDGAFEKQFVGSTIVWAENPNIDGVTGVAKVSAALIRNGVKSLKYIDEHILPLKQEFDSVYPTLAAKMTEKVSRAYAESAYAAATWLVSADGKQGKLPDVAKELASLGQPLSQEEIGHAKKNIVAYCEAKVWERAVRSTFINESYRARRPTPSGLCDGIYAENLKLILVTADACKGDPKVYRNYFGCLWHEGVVKTSLWKSRYGEDSKVTKAFEKLSDKSLMKFFSQQFNSDRFLMQKGEVNIPNLDDGTTVKIDLSFTHAAAGVESLSVAHIIQNMEEENAPGAQDELMRLFPSAGRNPDAQDVLNRANDSIRADLGYFSKLKANFYVNENAFNILFQKEAEKPEDRPGSVRERIKWKKAQAEEARERFSSVFQSKDPVVLRLASELQPLIQKIGAIGENVSRLAAEVNPEEPCTGKVKTLACTSKALSQEAAAAVTPEDVAQAVWQSSVKLAKSADGKFLYSEARLNLTRPYVVKGCAKMADLDCPEGFEKDSLSFDEETGDVSIRIPLKDIDAQGLVRSDRASYPTNFSFNDMAASDLRGSTLVYAGTLSLVDKTLLTLIGDVRIEREENGKQVPWAHGAIKLRDQAPEAERQMKALVGALKDLRAKM